MRNIKLTIAFDGTEYHGWQIQKDRRTVQGILSEALRAITAEEVALVGSGRTDAGVHARGLVANFVTHSSIPVSGLVRAVNGAIPRDIRVLSAATVRRQFHARRDAKSKVYRYQIYRGHILPPHLLRDHYHYPHPLNLAAMQRAAGDYVGLHDFASFAAKSGLKPDRNSVRQVFRSELRCRPRQMVYEVEGNGFLHHMVRNMVGTLIEIGRGRMTEEAFQELFAARDRCRAGFTAPPQGLTLLRVRY